MNVNLEITRAQKTIPQYAQTRLEITLVPAKAVTEAMEEHALVSSNYFQGFKNFQCQKLKIISEIDECVLSNPCDPNAKCTDGIGRALCSCNEGYSGDGLKCEGELMLRK